MNIKEKGIRKSGCKNGKTIVCRTQFDLNHPMWPPSESRQFVWRTLLSVEIFLPSFFGAEGRIRTVDCRSQFDLHYPM